MTTDIFPGADDDGCEPFRQIAKFTGCKEEEVYYSFRGIGVPQWITPEHIDAVQANTKAINNAARAARNLQDALNRLSRSDIETIIKHGGATPAQIAFLAANLEGWATDLTGWRAKQSRAGGKNPAAYAVAEGMRRLFRRLRRKITFGNHPDGGPSTDFSRAVEHAIGAFGIRAGWQLPAQRAWEKQSRINARLTRCRMDFERRERNLNPPKPPDLTGVSILPDGPGKFRVTLDDLTDIPGVTVETKWFSSGNELQKYAADWARRTRTEVREFERMRAAVGFSMNSEK
ncbi:hypothetical protein G5B39_12295 [Rhodobacteraceae bacterium SC52]|nr:hypothetical protein G5B39_12295 [Rhodobacteraceae bacterium SC52]